MVNSLASQGAHGAPLTTADLLWIDGRVERWIRFGRIVHEQVIDRRRRIVGFQAGAVFAFVRWTSNDYGTASSRLDVLRAVSPSEAFCTVPHVTPGADILLRVAGWPRVERVLQAVDAIEQLRIDPAAAAPDHWRHIHARLAARQAPRPYSRERHQAWLRRRRLLS